MANKFTKYLKSAASGFVSGATNPKGIVGNWQHATRLFVDDTYRLSPRTAFLFYVYFDINTEALKASSWKTDTHGQELGMLVKRANLPKFTFETETKNQYNRKKILHKTIKYDPVQIALHDDSNAVVTSLWALYYGYYIKDRHNQEMAYNYNQYADTLDQRYGLDNNVGTAGEKRPFFNSIQIFTMSRRRFVGYTLINPRITNWSSGDSDYFEGGTIESSMTLEYEAVHYTNGEVSYNTPKGFANLHYDTLPSPLTVQGGGVENLLGEGGVLDGAAQIFGDIGSGAAFKDPMSLIGTAIKAANTVKNLKNLDLKNLKGELLDKAMGAAIGMAIPLALSAAGGAMDAVGGMFPKSGEEGTDAVQKDTLAADASDRANNPNEASAMQASDAANASDRANNPNEASAMQAAAESVKPSARSGPIDSVTGKPLDVNSWQAQAQAAKAAGAQLDPVTGFPLSTVYNTTISL